MHSFVGSLTWRLRRVTAPLRWSAVAIVGWTHRYTVALWARSLLALLAGGNPRWFADLRPLVRALVKVSVHHRLANAPELRRLRVVDGTIQADVEDDEWPDRALIAKVVGHGPRAAVEPDLRHAGTVAV